MARRSLPRLRDTHNDERGQIAVGMLLMFLMVFMVAALALDAGFWFFDHRTAQNQAESAALAAALELPAWEPSDQDDACDAAKASLAENNVTGAGSATCTTGGSCAGITPGQIRILFTDENNDTKNDRVRVCLRRESLLLLSKMSGVTFARVSASAAVLAGPAAGTSVFPFAFPVQDRTCDTFADDCNTDANGDGILQPSELNSCDFIDCPFGLNPKKLMSFRLGGDGLTIRACGNGANEYKECILGNADNSSGFNVGEEVDVDIQPGDLGNVTPNTLDEWADNNGDPSSSCDVPSTPDPLWDGLDEDVVDNQLAAKLDDPACEYRKVVVILMCYELATNCTPTGNGLTNLYVHGLAVFYVADWSKKSSAGTTVSVCTEYNGPIAPPGQYDCGNVWGYLLFGEEPDRRFQLDRIDTTVNNPLAPILIALVE